MIDKKVLSLVLIAIGLLLLFFAYQSSQSMGDQMSEAVTGRFTDSTTWYMILGVASSIAGFGMLLYNKPGNS